MPHQPVDDREFEHLTNQLPAAVFVQVKGRFAYLNREALKVFGETQSEALVGKPVLSRIPRERWTETTARIARNNRDKVQGPSRTSSGPTVR
jgi:PAS domain S-box-containing protein